MVIKPGSLPGVYEIVLSPHPDERGFFMRTYDASVFRAHSIERRWVQENHSRSVRKGIIRGLHFQFPPHAETKLVRVIRGAVFDVFVDLRKGSPTLGRWGAVELSEQNKKMILIPRGFAHGFCTLTDLSEVAYKVDNYYTPEAEGGIIYDDKTIGIRWPVLSPIMSTRDAALGTFDEFLSNHGSLDPK